jgi:hypothetical protein
METSSDIANTLAEVTRVFDIFMRFKVCIEDKTFTTVKRMAPWIREPQAREREKALNRLLSKTATASELCARSNRVFITLLTSEKTVGANLKSIYQHPFYKINEGL